MPPKYKRTNINLWDPSGNSELIISTGADFVNFNKKISVDDIVLDSFPNGINNKIIELETKTLQQNSNTIFKISEQNVKYVYNGVKNANPISFNEESVQTRTTDLNIGVIETTQFQSKRLLQENDWIYVDSDTNQFWKISPDSANSPPNTPGHPLIYNGQLPGSGEIIGKIQIKHCEIQPVPLYLPNGNVDQSKQLLLSIVSLDISNEIWIVNPPYYSVYVKITHQTPLLLPQLVLLNPDTGDYLENFILGNEYTFDLSDPSLINFQLLDINSHIGINSLYEKQLTGISYGVFPLHSNQQDLNSFIGYQFNSNHIQINSQTNEMTLNPIDPGIIGSEVSWFINENYITKLSKADSHLEFLATVQHKNDKSIQFSVNVNIIGNTNSNTNSDPFQIHKTIKLNTNYKPEYIWFHEQNRWVVNDSASPLLFDYVYDIPSKIVFDSLHPIVTQNLVLEINPPEPTHNRPSSTLNVILYFQSKIFIHMVSQYIGNFYLNPFFALPDSDIVNSDSRHYIPTNYKPFITVGICWKLQSESQWIFDSKYTKTTILDNIFKSYRGGAYHDGNFGGYHPQGGHFYFTNNIVHFIENTFHSENFHFHFSTTANQAIQFCPFIEFMGMVLRLHANIGEFTLSAQIIN